MDGDKRFSGAPNFIHAALSRTRVTYTVRNSTSSPSHNPYHTTMITMPLITRRLILFVLSWMTAHVSTSSAIGDNAWAPLQSQARDLYAASRYDEAYTLLQQVLELQEKTLGPAHSKLGDSLTELGLLYAHQGRYEQAMPLFQQALTIREKSLGPEHSGIAVPLNHLAMVYQAQGRYEQAEARFRRCLLILKKNYGMDHPDVATSLNNLGAVIQQQGRYDQAEQFYRRSLKIREKVLGRFHPDVATSLNNLALSYKVQGRYKQAERFYNQSLRIREKIVGKDHPGLVTSLNNLAALHYAQGFYEQAEPLFQRALKILESYQGENHPDVAMSLNNLASLYDAQGRYDKAELILKRTLKIKEQTLGPDHISTASSLHNLAGIYRSQGYYDQARSLYERALNIKERALGLDHPELAIGYNSLAVLSGEQGDDEQAQEFFNKTLRIIEAHIQRSLMTMNAIDRLALAHEHRPYLDHWLLYAGQARLPAYPEVLRFKGMVTRATWVDWRAARHAEPDTKELLDKLGFANAFLAKLSKTSPQDHDELEDWKKSYAEAAQLCEELYHDVAASSAQFREARKRLDLTITQVQAHLQPDERLIDFVLYHDRYAAWIVSPVPGSDPIRIELGDAEPIEQAVTHLRQTIVGPNAVHHSSDLHFLDAGLKLRNLLWEPLAAHLSQDVTTVYLVPDAAIAAVPFAVIPANEKVDVSNPQFLIDKYALAYLSFAQELVPWKNPVQPGKGLLAIGGVDYNRSGQTPPKDLQEAVITRGRPTLNPADLRSGKQQAPGEVKVKPLPDTQQEIESIRKLFRVAAPNEPSVLLQGPHATEGLLRNFASGKRFLHLATHAYIDTELPSVLDRQPSQEHLDRLKGLSLSMERHLVGYDPMLLSYLVMAGFNQRKGGGDDDGALTALEASSLNLEGVQLAVLSACNTGGGTARIGEGVLGLVRGFQQAGVGTVVASLWPISDRATSMLMELFYNDVLAEDDAVLPTAQALRAASLQLRRYKEVLYDEKASKKLGQEIVLHRCPFDAPRHWAAFVVYGPVR